MDASANADTGPITVETTVRAPMARVWEYWNGSEHIPHWSFAADDWGAEPRQNDLRPGGSFLTKMFAKDNSFSFDFGGVYTDVVENARIEYDLGDGRHVKTVFSEVPGGVRIVQSFDAETENPRDVQQAGWQAFLDNFKKYVEGN